MLTLFLHEYCRCSDLLDLLVFKLHKSAPLKNDVLCGLLAMRSTVLISIHNASPIEIHIWPLILLSGGLYVRGKKKSNGQKVQKAVTYLNSTAHTVNQQ